MTGNIKDVQEEKLDGICVEYMENSIVSAFFLGIFFFGIPTGKGKDLVCSAYLYLRNQPVPFLGRTSGSASGSCVYSDGRRSGRLFDISRISVQRKSETASHHGGGTVPWGWNGGVSSACSQAAFYPL